MGSKSRYLDLVLFELVLRHFQIVEEFVVLALVLVELLHIVIQGLEDANLDELFQRQVVVGPILQVDISFLGNQKVRLREVLLVGVEFLFEEGDFAACILLT